jgi:hypothetical protein
MGNQHKWSAPKLVLGCVVGSVSLMEWHLSVLQWARENGCPWDEDICSAAAKGGHLSVLQWARENGCKWNEWTCSQAASGGHLEVLQWASENGCPWNWRVCRGNAGRSGSVDVMRWLDQILLGGERV